VRVAICILARNEENGIAACLHQLAGQSIFEDQDLQIQVHVVANGCTDGTAQVAGSARQEVESRRGQLFVHDLVEGGKSRAWNRAVHSLVPPDTDLIFFVDADVQLISKQVLADLMRTLRASTKAKVCTGYPVKDITTKQRKTPLDRFSLLISGATRHVGAINGSLYLSWGESLRAIWLPDQTPGEDGFLNAMVNTDGFTNPGLTEAVVSASEPTHYFRAHRIRDFFAHERRMIVGTMVNIWIFEYLWSLKLEQPAGPLIAQWNKDDPDWVEAVIQRNATSRRWVVRSNIIFGRFRGGAGKSVWRRIAYLPNALLATLLTLPPAIGANRRLQRLGAAKTW
jgi:glycosyltransferase involved in cell wall biosynthesis